MASVVDQNIREGTLSYVGVLREISEVRYGNLPLVVFRGSWVPPNVNGRVGIKRDKFGFRMANLWRRQHATTQPNVFPLHVQQVFFHDDEEEIGWKVVLQSNCQSIQTVLGDREVNLGANLSIDALDAICNVASAIANEANVATVGDVVIPIGVGVIGRLQQAQRDGAAWEGDWSLEDSDSATDHDCDSEEDPWWVVLER